MHLSGPKCLLSAIGTLLLTWSFSAAQGADALLLGRAALADKQPAEAERHLVGYLAANQSRPGDCPAALLLLLRAVSDQGRPADVLSLLEANADIVSNAPPARIAYWRARSLLELGRSEPALSVVTEQLPAAAAALSRDSAANDRESRIADYALLLRIQARALAETPGKGEQAEATFKAVDDLLSPTQFPVMKAANLYEWARLASGRGEVKDAGDLLQRLDALSPALTNTPSLPLEEGLLLRTSILLGKGKENEAIPLLHSLATNETATLPNRAEALLSLVELSVKEERRQPAAPRPRLLPSPGAYASTLKDFTDAMAAERAWEINRRFGRLLLSATSSIPIGAGILSKTIQERPSAPESPSDRLAIADGWLAISSNLLAAAEYQSFLEAYQGSPSEVIAARRGQATALMRTGDYDESATLFQKIADSTDRPDLRSECLLLAARSLRAGGKYERAAGLFTQAAEVPSTTNDGKWVTAVYFDAADSLERAANLRAAREAFKKIAEAGVPPALSDKALYRAAQISDRMGDRGDAIKSYSELIERTSDGALKNQALLGRGRDHYGRFQFMEAIDDFASIDPAYHAIAAEADFYRLFCLYATERDEEALAGARRFIAERPTSRHLPAIVLWLAQYHYNLPDYAKAQEIFTDYAKRWPTSPETAKALLWGATAAFERAEYQQSIDLLAELLRSFASSPLAGEARFLQAKALCNLARYEEAILALNDVINRYPANEFVTDAWILLGDALFSSASSEQERKRYTEASEAYGAARARCNMVTARGQAIPSSEDFIRFVESNYKIGRCLEKRGDLLQARRHYYENVITPYLGAVQNGAFSNSQAAVWFDKAVLQSADLLEHEGNLEGAISVLGHLSGAEGPERDQARRMSERLEKARLK